MKPPLRRRIEPQTGCAVRVNKGQTLRVIDPEGEQVADLFAFANDDHRVALSSGRSIDYANRIYLTTGDILYANTSQPMFTITADRVGRHDFLLAPCSLEMFHLTYAHQGHHPSCFENLSRGFDHFGIEDHRIATTFNIFMLVEVRPDGSIEVGVPPSKAGDYIDLRAEMDLVAGLTACSAEKSNNHAFKPIDFEVHDDAPASPRV